MDGRGTLRSRIKCTIRIAPAITGQLTDKPTRGQSSRGLDNLRTGQLADIMKLLYFICTLKVVFGNKST